MKSIDKLRDLADDINAKEIVEHMQLYPNCVFDCRWLDSWHSEFNRLIESLEAEIAANYLELPVDADGVPIHVGDMVDGWGTLEMYGCGKQPVHGMYCAATIAGGIGWRIDNEYGFEVVPKHLRHVKPRTLENVLRDCCDEYYKACKSEHAINLADIHRKYADEIRELLSKAGD